MGNPPPDISIVLLTYNGDVYLGEVLESIFAQNTRFTYEVIAIDSGSTDGTLEILKSHPLRLIQIPNREFGHGRTRNLGVRQSEGKYVVFLTQDATPGNDSWLENLVRPLAQDEKIVGVYSRQLPRVDCDPWEARDIALGAGPLPVLKRVDFHDAFQEEQFYANQLAFIAFSNVSSGIRKSVLESLRFSESIVMVEDQEWCKRVIEAGHSVVYEAASTVYHSHNHSLRMIYKRHFDYGKSLKEFVFLPMRPQDVLLYTGFQAVGDVIFILSRWQRGLAATLLALLKVPIVRFLMRLGLYRGLGAKA